MKQAAAIIGLGFVGRAHLEALRRIGVPVRGMLGSSRERYPGGHAEGYPDTFVQLFRDFYGYLDAGNLGASRPFPTFANGNHELLLCEAIAKSARDRAWIPVLWE
jgi:predicted dehydrogenase